MGTRVIKDPAHPDFPHGTPRGYGRGCKCRPCTNASTRAKHIRDCATTSGRLLPTQRRSAAAATAHLRDLVDLTPWASRPNLAHVAGVDWDTIDDLLAGRLEFVQIATDRAVRRLDVDLLRRHAPSPPVSVAIQRVRSMQALGWPLDWQARRLGYTGQRQPPFLSRRSARVTRAVFDRVEALYREVGDRPGPSTRARLTAARRGAHPPICHDDDGTLIPGCLHYAPAGAREADRAARRDQRAERRLTALRHVLIDRLPVTVAAERTSEQWGSTPVRVVQRWLAAAGLRLDYDEESEQTRPAAVSADRAARVVDVLRDWSDLLRLTAEEAERAVFPLGAIAMYERVVEHLAAGGQRAA